MTALDSLLAGKRMPLDKTELVGALAEARARGLECAAEDARIFGHDEFADHLERRVDGVRKEAVNRPPMKTGSM